MIYFHCYFSVNYFTESKKTSLNFLEEREDCDTFFIILPVVDLINTLVDIYYITFVINICTLTFLLTFIIRNTA